MGRLPPRLWEVGMAKRFTRITTNHYGVCDWCEDPFEPGDKIFRVDRGSHDNDPDFVCPECKSDDERGLTFTFD